MSLIVIPGVPNCLAPQAYTFHKNKASLSTVLPRRATPNFKINAPTLGFPLENSSKSSDVTPTMHHQWTIVNPTMHHQWTVVSLTMHYQEAIVEQVW